MSSCHTSLRVKADDVRPTVWHLSRALDDPGRIAVDKALEQSKACSTIILLINLSMGEEADPVLARPFVTVLSKEKAY